MTTAGGGGGDGDGVGAGAMPAFATALAIVGGVLLLAAAGLLYMRHKEAQNAREIAVWAKGALAVKSPLSAGGKGALASRLEKQQHQKQQKQQQQQQQRSNTVAVDLARGAGIEISTGLVVTSVEPGSAAEQQGLTVGCTVTALVGVEIRSLAEFRQAVALFQRRGDASFTLTFTPPGEADHQNNAGANFHEFVAKAARGGGSELPKMPSADLASVYTMSGGGSATI